MILWQNLQISACRVNSRLAATWCANSQLMWIKVRPFIIIIILFSFFCNLGNIDPERRTLLLLLLLLLLLFGPTHYKWPPHAFQSAHLGAATDSNRSISQCLLPTVRSDRRHLFCTYIFEVKNIEATGLPKLVHMLTVMPLVWL